MSDFAQKIKKLENEIFILRSKISNLENNKRELNYFLKFLIKSLSIFFTFNVVFYLMDRDDFLQLSLVLVVGYIFSEVILKIAKIFFIK
ncbi:MAG: hypothetical protein KatS3mg085_833 [Candidatus Dojkabacteria bacterium]|nr:MAG: hypothetical protein KatS3mg085_833 [Candidatus Dojkabacteria bacterium]